MTKNTSQINGGRNGFDQSVSVYTPSHVLGATAGCWEEKRGKILPPWSLWPSGEGNPTK